MRVDKQLDLVFSVLVTSSRWESSREFEWVHARYPRFDVCTQVLSTYAALPFHRHTHRHTARATAAAAGDCTRVPADRPAPAER